MCLGEVSQLTLLEHTVKGCLSLLACACTVVRVAEVTAKSTLKFVRIGRAVGQSGINLVNLFGSKRACQAVVLANHLVGNGHGLAKHVCRLVGQANVIAVRLTHLTHAIGALEQRHGECHLRLHTHLLHELAARKKIEELVGATHLYVSLDLHRVKCLHNGIQELMQGDGSLRLITLGKVVTLKNACHRKLGAQLEHALEVQRQNPVTVMHDSGFLRIQNLHGLINVGLCVGLNLLLRELWARRVLTRRIANHGGTVTNDEGNLVTQVLELAHLAQWHSMAQMKVGTRGVNAQLNVERLALLEFLFQIGLGHNLSGTRSDDTHLLFNRQHGILLSS